METVLSLLVNTHTERDVRNKTRQQDIHIGTRVQYDRIDVNETPFRTLDYHIQYVLKKKKV